VVTDYFVGTGVLRSVTRTLFTHSEIRFLFQT